MLKEKGFTMMELIMLIAIVALLSAVIIPMFVNPAHGMDLRTYYKATPENEHEIVKILRRDSSLTVVVVIYAKEWKKDGKEMNMISPGVRTAARLNRQFGARVSVLIANSPGLVEDPMPTPAENGVYLYLD